MKNLRARFLMATLILVTMAAAVTMAHATAPLTRPTTQQHENGIKVTPLNVEQPFTPAYSELWNRVANETQNIPSIYTERATTGACVFADSIIAQGPAMWPSEVLGMAALYRWRYC